MPASGRSWVVPGVIATLIVALLAASGVIWSHRGRHADPGMLVTAKLETANLVSLDYRHAEKDADRILALATGKFKREFAAQRKHVVAAVVKKKVVLSASIPKDGLASELVNGNKGQVLVAVDVTTTAANGASTVDRYRARVFLTKVDGRWLVSALDANRVG